MKFDVKITITIIIIIKFNSLQSRIAEVRAT